MLSAAMLEAIEVVWAVLVRLGRGEDGGEVGLGGRHFRALRVM